MPAQPADDRPSTDDSTLRLGFLLKRAHLRYGERVNAALAPLGVDARSWVTLTLLDGGPPVSQVEVAQLLGVDRTTMVAIVDGLQDKGLVERRRSSHDRRKNLIALTEPGREVCRRGTGLVDETERQFLAPLDEPDARRLRATLLRLLAADGESI